MASSGETKEDAMTATYQLLEGNCLEVLKSLPSNSIHCVITSIPYWSLRVYDIDPVIWDGDPKCKHNFESEIKINKKRFSANANDVFCSKCGAWKGSLGLEPSIDLFLKHIVDIFDEIKRVLRNDGTCWLNVGDSYAQQGVRNNKEQQLANQKRAKSKNYHTQAFNSSKGWDRGVSSRSAFDGTGIKTKDLVGQPWLVAFALRSAGWFLRADIIWHKLTAMPESVVDRPSRAHEYIFLLTKTASYYYDRFAVQEPAAAESFARASRAISSKNKYVNGAPGQNKQRLNQPRKNAKESDKKAIVFAKRNRRTVWSFANQSFKGSHFATFPVVLPEICLKAGSSEHGCCYACAAPFKRIVKPSSEYSKLLGKGYHDHSADLYRGKMSAGKKNENFKHSVIAEYLTVGWKPTCSCYDDKYKAFPRTKNHKKLIAQNKTGSWIKRAKARPLSHVPVVPCTILDPFAGSGTTMIASMLNNRNSIGIELSAKYVELAKERIETDTPKYLAKRLKEQKVKPIKESENNLYSFTNQIQLQLSLFEEMDSL